MEDGATKKRKAMALCVQDESSLKWKFIKWTLAVVFYKAPGSSPFPCRSCLDARPRAFPPFFLTVFSGSKKLVPQEACFCFPSLTMSL